MEVQYRLIMIIASRLKHKFTWLVFLLVVLGSFLRVWKYWEFPIAGETQDEAAWTWLGASLIQDGQPTSWSFFDQYGVYQWLSFGNTNFRIVRPVLDHPPLFSLLPGSIHSLSQDSGDYLVYPSIKQIRFPIVVLSIINLLLFAQWLRVIKIEKFGDIGKLTALSVYATAPSFVFLSRLVVSENLLVTWLLVLLLVSQSTNRWSQRVEWLALLALPITKISGIAIAVAEVVTRVVNRQSWRPRALFTIFGVGLVLIYAGLFDFDLFLLVQTQQASRESGLLTLFSTQWWSHTLVQKLFGDIWISLGLMAGLFCILMGNSNKEKQVSYFFLGQLAFILISVGEHTIHGWYRIPLFPLMAFYIGWIVQQVWDQRNWLGLALGWIFAMPILRMGWIAVDIHGLFSWQAILAKIILILAGISAIAVVQNDRYQRRLWSVLTLMLVFVVIISNLLTVLFLEDRAYWLDALYLEQGIRP